jgi:hypothetical protein
VVSIIDAASIEGGDCCEEDDGAEHGRDDEEGGEVVASEGERQSGGADDSGSEHAVSDEEGHHGCLVGTFGEHGGTAGMRVLGDEFGVGGSGQESEGEGDQHRRPGDAADFSGNLPDEGVDSGPEDITEDEQVEHLPGDVAFYAGCRRGCAGVMVGGAHPATLTICTSVGHIRRVLRICLLSVHNRGFRLRRGALWCGG